MLNVQKWFLLIYNLSHVSETDQLAFVVKYLDLSLGDYCEIEKKITIGFHTEQYHLILKFISD